MCSTGEGPPGTLFWNRVTRAGVWDLYRRVDRLFRLNMENEAITPLTAVPIQNAPYRKDELEF